MQVDIGKIYLALWEEDDGSGARNARWQPARIVAFTGSGPSQRWTVVWLEKKDGGFGGSGSC